ncbi:MAG: type I DNA topoisomerase [Candidatus Paceibacterota bacterium]|jgi:DNA topoisomerase-1|nr:type I DNA topoisomerase [Candidatus Paceibacterota bacterium]MDD4875389.1 type I DNA topoisomerase [Candidatus Paceibacterota bacterium]
MKLIIVESPTKAKTISKFLGSGWEALSSYGHIRDLPQKKFGIDLEKDFEPQYTIVPKAKKNLDLLKKAVKKADEIIISTDPDREGEAIAWHLTKALGLKNEDSYQRIVFHEITKSAIEEAMKNPRKIDMSLVDAQQARRILDRIVGYKLSPFLWKKIVKGLSAGRVQSVAVRLVCDREEEIKKFIPQEYWSIAALLFKTGSENKFEAMLSKKNGKTIAKLDIKNKEEAGLILKDLEKAGYKVLSVEAKETKKNPLPPFTTSTIQQEAWKKFHLPSKMTMGLAQQLYENGYITYHRTDSLNLSESALAGAKNFIVGQLGQNYWAGEYRRFKAKGLVQEAHEAIRPSAADQSPEQLEKEGKLSGSQLKLYGLIWRRFIASQMSQAVFDSTAVDIEAAGESAKYIFRANGQILKFDGFLKIYPLKFAEAQLPVLTEGETLNLSELKPEQHFTQPPPRYTEASLIKALEENGIGRPSTYAPTLNTVQTRNYIEKDENKRFKPTEMGGMVNNLLVSHFPQIVDIKFTAKMEEDLDKIAEAEKEWVKVLKEFYDPFAQNLKAKYDEVAKTELAESATDKICPKCKSPIIIKMGRFGKFYACSNFPECKHTESMKDNNLHIKCPKCKEGDIIKKMSKRRKPFYGCSKWPDCDFAAWDEPIDKFCPECKSILVKTKKGIKCSNKECGYKEESEK